jgi:Fe-S-cluster containining protein
MWVTSEVAKMSGMNSANQPVFHWDYDQKLVIQYLRQGQCSRCGGCCKGHLPISIANKYDPDIPQQGGKCTDGKGLWIEIIHKRQRVFFKTGKYQPREKVCTHLNAKNECISYSRRPLFCQEFPLSPDNITAFPECTYSFKKVGEWTFHQLSIERAVKEVKGRK